MLTVQCLSMYSIVKSDMLLNFHSAVILVFSVNICVFVFVCVGISVYVFVLL